MAKNKRNGKRGFVKDAMEGPGSIRGTRACPWQIFDDKGHLNCLACDGSVGYCSFEQCPRRLWQMRQIMRQAFQDLKIQLNINSELMKFACGRRKRWLRS